MKQAHLIHSRSRATAGRLELALDQTTEDDRHRRHSQMSNRLRRIISWTIESLRAMK